MGKRFVVVAAVSLLAVLGTIAQVRKKSPARVAPKPAVAASPAEYEIKTVLLPGQGLFLVHINPDPDYPGPLEDTFQGFFKDHFGTRPRDPNRALPKIVIGFGDEDKVADMIKAADSVRVLPKVVVELEGLTSTVRVVVPPRSTERQILEVKPNPLTLVVASDKGGNVTLNNEQMGKLADLSHLTTFLTDIYRQREENGVFRPDTNEIEKSIFIAMPLDASGADLSKVVKALEDAGADRISLQIEDLADQRKGLEDLPTTPPKKKPTR